MKKTVILAFLGTFMLNVVDSHAMNHEWKEMNREEKITVLENLSEQGVEKVKEFVGRFFNKYYEFDDFIWKLRSMNRKDLAAICLIAEHGNVRLSTSCACHLRDINRINDAVKCCVMAVLAKEERGGYDKLRCAQILSDMGWKYAAAASYMAIAKTEDDAYINISCAKALKEMGLEENAVKCYMIGVLAKKSEYEDHKFLCLEALIEMDRKSEAIKCCMMAVEKEEDFSCKLKFAKALEELSPEDATKCYMMIVEMVPIIPDTGIRTGASVAIESARAFRRMGLEDNEVACYMTAAKNGCFAAMTLDCARVLKSMGRKKEAIECCKMAKEQPYYEYHQASFPDLREEIDEDASSSAQDE